jgi:hypothetical protein
MAESYPLPPRLAEIAADLPLDEIAFEPVPVKSRRDGWSAERQRGFIIRLALSGSVSASAAAVGMTKRSAHDLRRRPQAESFAAAWDKAAGWGVGARCDYALERSIAGETRPVFYKGRRCGERIHFNHGLTIAVLNMAARDGLGSASAERDRLILNDFLGQDR